MWVKEQLPFPFNFIIWEGEGEISTNLMIKGPGHSGSGGYKDDGTAGRGQPSRQTRARMQVWCGWDF